jgi:hypothetical protein
LGGLALGFLNTVVAPLIAANIFTPAANFSDSAGDDRLLQPDFVSREASASAGFPVVRSGYWKWKDIELHSTPFKVAYADDAAERIAWFAGKIPDRKPLVDLLSEAGTGHDLHPVQAQGIFADRLRTGSWNLPLPKPVIRLGHSGPENWWRMVAGVGDRIFWLRERDGAFTEEQPADMQADGKAKLYRENKVSSAATGIEEFALSDLLDASYLRNRLFRILNCLGGTASFQKCGNFARSRDGIFSYPFDSVQYSEMAAYYSIQKAIGWHRGILSEKQHAYFSDFNLAGPIDVFVRNVTAGGPSYSSRNSKLNTKNPVIFVPEESAGLVNLSRDSDVYFHEFSHHVIYRSVKPTNENPQSQARAIQEGLADYFAYAMSGNNLLGESTTEGPALRQGTKDLAVYPEIFSDAYAVGEVLSSVLWTLRVELGEWKNGYFKVDKIAWDAVDLMPELGTFYQYACAVVKTADAFEKSENIAAGTLKAPIVSRFADRAFFENTTLNAATGCPVASAVLKAVDQGESQESELPLDVVAPVPVKFSGQGPAVLPPFGGSLYQALQPRKTGCGVVAELPQTSRMHWLTLLALFMPLLLSALKPRRFFR